MSLDGSWLKVNDTVCDLFGYSRPELLNMDTQHIVYRDDLGVHENHYEELINGHVDKYEVWQRYFHKNGNLLWTFLSASLIRNSYGEPSYLIWQITDVTEFKKNQEKLHTMLNLANEQNDRLSAFAEITTHNLRSHSGNIKTLTEFIATEHTWLSMDENFSYLQKAVENLEDTVFHLTEIAKVKQIEPGELVSLNLYDFAEKAIYNVLSTAKNAGAIISNTIDEDIRVKGIPAYLDSIILNFLTNAIKYRSKARQAKIELSAKLENNYVILKVKDNGLGIDLNKHGNAIFQMYKTFHNNNDATGIGLFITKNHIESIGGKVTVTSEVGIGSTFSVHLQSD